MKIVDVLQTECVILLKCSDKSSALAEMARNICDNYSELDYESLLEAVLHRESLMSTGLGEGLAVPHVRLANLDRAAMAVGICKKGINDYGSLDSKPVHILVMIAAPIGQHEMYLQLMAQSVEKLKDAATREKLLEMTEPQQIIDIMTE